MSVIFRAFATPHMPLVALNDTERNVVFTSCFGFLSAHFFDSCECGLFFLSIVLKWRYYSSIVLYFADKSKKSDTRMRQCDFLHFL